MFHNGSMQSNLDCFLNCTTPVVTSQFLPKSEGRNMNRLHPEKETVDYFSLNNLWNCYDEWSAYGTGVPIALNNGEKLVQYYVPYLSGIQIFTSSSSLKLLREENESVERETRDSLSDSYSDSCESEKLWTWDGTSSSSEGGTDPDYLWHMNDRLGHLYCQYFDRSAPYGRAPLSDMMNSLTQRYPGLMSLRSVDLSPASWMAVAWYPIYHIPKGRTMKDLSTCFLTYHTLSFSFQDMDLEDEILGSKKKREAGDSISLHPFGLVTYKMQGNLWVSGNNGRDQARLSSLTSVADSWLKQLRVHHHDFTYFMSMRLG